MFSEHDFAKKSLAPFPSSRRKSAKSSALATFILLATILVTSLAVAVGLRGKVLATMPLRLCPEDEASDSSGGIRTRRPQLLPEVEDEETPLLQLPPPLPKLPYS